MSAELKAQVVVQLRIDVSYWWPNKLNTRDAATHLMGCSEHKGTHHFAVVNDGHSLGMTFSAENCLRKAGLIE